MRARQVQQHQQQHSVTIAASAALAYAVISIASNFVTKMAGIMLPGAPDAVLAVQLATMLGVMHAARAAGYVDWAPTTTARVLAFMPQSLTYGAHAALVLRALAMLNVPIYNTLKRMTPIIVLTAKIFLDGKLPGLGITGSVLLTVMGCVVAGIGDLTFELRSYMVALAAAGLQATYVLLTEYASPSGSTGAAPRVISLSQFSPTSPNSSSTYTSGGAFSPGGGGGGGGGLGGGAGGGADGKTVEVAVDGTGRQHMRSESGNAAAEFLRHSAGQSTASSGSNSSWIPAGLRPALCVAAESMHYASLTCLPLAAGWALLTGQWQAARAGAWEAAGAWDDPWDLPGGAAVAVGVWLAAMASMEWLLTGSLVVCTQTNSALTTTVVGVLKGILAVVLGFFLLGGVGPQGMSWMGILGITMNCTGGVWYAVVKCREGAASSAKPAKN